MTEPVMGCIIRALMSVRKWVQLSAPAGRPMLTWRGKRVLRRAAVEPARLVETFNPTDGRGGSAGELFGDPAPDPALILHGDNKYALAHLLVNGYRAKIKLIYIDPPFDTGGQFARKVVLRGKGARRALRTDDYALGDQVQYADVWADDTYLQFVFERLQLMRELLSEDGSIWLHCDYRRVHYLRLLLEEVFGADNYLNTVAWRSQTARGAKVNAFYFPNSTQFIEVFARNRAAPTTWNLVRKQLIMSETEADANFMHDDQGYFRTSDPGTYGFERLVALHAENRLYAPYNGKIVVDERRKRVYASNGGNIGVKYRLKKLHNGNYAAERAIDNFWDDIPGLGTTPIEDLGYPTQKTEALLNRIIAVSTNPGDLVMDCFAGSGTTAAVAQKLGRRWIACDANTGAIQTIKRRLQHVQNQQKQAIGFAVYQVGRADPVLPSSGQVSAQITFERCMNCTTPLIRITVTNYDSPSVLARLHRHAGMDTSPAIADWRMIVDSIMIDAAYDGAVFNVSLSDVPQRKHDLVRGTYEVHAPQGPTVVGVRITDILGTELMVTGTV